MVTPSKIFVLLKFIACRVPCTNKLVRPSWNSFQNPLFYKLWSRLKENLTKSHINKKLKVNHNIYILL